MAFTLGDLKTEADWQAFITTCKRESSYLATGGPITSSASARDVFTILNDATTWKSWSSFVPRIEVTNPGDPAHSTALTLGTRMKWGVAMDAMKPQSLTASELVVDGYHGPDATLAQGGNDPGQGKKYYTTWSTVGMPRWLHFGRRVWEIEDLGDGKASRISCYEFQRGPLVWLIWLMYDARLQEAYDLSCAELRRYCEEQNANRE